MRLLTIQDEDLRRIQRLLEDSLKVIADDLKEFGGCDHSVGICCCGIVRLAEELQEEIVLIKAKVGDVT